MPKPAANGGVVRPEQVVERLRRMVEDYRRSRGSRPSSGHARAVRCGLDPLDQALPDGGLPIGAVTEILCGAPGLGATSLALRTAHRAATDGRTVVVVDPGGDFYPPATIPCGMDLDRLVVIRPRRAPDALWALDQSLRCPAIAAVVAWLDHLRPEQSRRLQLAAEAGKGLGLILKPAAGREKSFAAVRVLIEPVTEEAAENQFPTKSIPSTACEASDGIPGDGDGSGSSVRLCRITVLKVREGIPGEPFIVGLDDEAGFVPVHAVPSDRPLESARRRESA
jgi:protein ImuA